jgi:hypothetical protein
MADTLAELRNLPEFNGRAAVMAFCYGGPYAILGHQARLHDAGCGRRLQQDDARIFHGARARHSQ